MNKPVKIPTAKSLNKIANKQIKEFASIYSLDLFAHKLIEHLKIEAKRGSTSYVTRRLSANEYEYFIAYWQPLFQEKGYSFMKYDMDRENGFVSLFITWI
jgi:hypothetical protein